MTPIDEGGAPVVRRWRRPVPPGGLYQGSAAATPHPSQVQCACLNDTVQCCIPGAALPRWWSLGSPCQKGCVKGRRNEGVRE